MLSSDGDGSAWVKYSGKNVVIGAGDADRVTVSPGNTTLSNDISPNGGLARDYSFYKVRLRQASFPVMTSSYLSGARDAEDSAVFTRIPLMKAGSVLGIALITQDCTVKSGSLSGTITISGTPSATGTVGMSTGTIAYNTFAKDLITFTAGQYLEVQLSASTTFATDLDPNSGSFHCLVSVEY